ncbi:sensor histidine kinase YesM [Aquimarina sp. EL_43]|uniref:sensor histidine kinase n=1 Tax=unclassified Aquimarina TaxID=2627091 RepID=UPI0018C9A37F|nr:MULTISPECIES: histidine kinase [unclassified Aquimarina]MBG6128628.1 sensor histidine kinase YesM [Aquimarina sp. EL_35]MBG6149691.1 sensor histidine kinase YesM [Aquimarina sp. EL_32]MBG6167624.1 sensor histidine kinase YesM [Aquimarina sp. EL_43]
MNIETPKISLGWRLVIVFIVGIVMFSIIAIASKFREAPKVDLLFLLLWMSIIYLSFEVIHQLQKKLVQKNLNSIWIFLGSSIGGTVIYTIFFYFYKWLDYLILGSEPPMIQHVVFSALTGLAICMIFGLILLTFNWKNQYYISHIQNEQFKKEIIKANLSILKNQLDPHFMFNNFNTLYYLIDEDGALAQKFLKNIASVYRYILQNNEKAIIPISREYEMARQYLLLIEQRYKTALKVHDAVDSSFFEYKSVPPLVLQQLIENAVKHNRIDERSPLHIHFEVTENYFTVKNNNNPKRSTSGTTGTGLENITKRYDFLTENKVIISNTKDEFRVSIPLLPTTNEINSNV